MKPNQVHLLEALYVVFLAFCLVALSSCAHDPKMEKKIEGEAAQQPVVPLGSPMLAESQEVIEEAPLTPKQKNELQQIVARTSTDLKALRDEESQLRLLFVKQMVNPQATDREVDAIRKRILEVVQKNNKRWLSGVDEAKKVIGRRTLTDEKYYRVFMKDTMLRAEYE